MSSCSWSEKALIAVTSAAAGICALKAWELIVVPRIFAARLREIARAAREPCVLDVSKETVASYRRGGIDLIRKDLRASCLPTHVVEFFDALLITRGVDQAFRTKIELVNFKKVVLHLQNLFEAAESELSVFSAMLYVPHDSEGSTKEARKRDVQILKDLDECRGMLHVLREVRTWTAAICKVPRYPTRERLFIASDSEIRSIPVEMGAAGGLKGRLDALQRKVAARASEFKFMVDEQGWPPQCAGSQGKGQGGEGASKGGKGQRECARCGLGFGRKWLVGALCWKCREELKGSGECWKLVRKKDSEGGGGGTRTCYVCPHSGKCLGCEEASCNACRMVRLSDMDDGLSSYVQDLEMQVGMLFLDWDQTLSSTKSGGLFVAEKHGLSAQLCVAAMTPQWQVHIVTRQHTSHEQAIVAVLNSAGLGHIKVHCLGGTKLRKADIILPLLKQCPSSLFGVFLDDDKRELLDADIRDEPRLLRVLCAPADWRPLSSFQ